MRIKPLILAVILSAFALIVRADNFRFDAVPAQIDTITAPFPMPQLQRPAFPQRSLSITKSGARQGVMATEAIQKTIDKLARKGGGTVIVPQGQWQCGRIELKSNINLCLEEGAELHFSGDVSDYLPVVPTRYEGVDVQSLGAMVYARDAQNIAITGQGKLVGPSEECEIYRRQEAGVTEEVIAMSPELRVFDGREGQNVYMPVFFGPVNCTNVLVEGVTFERSLFWNIVPIYCQSVIIRDVLVSAFGHGRTDGIDIDSSRDVLVEYVTLDCGDDCFTLKAGRGMDGVRRNKPTENVVIRHCRVNRGVGGIAIGSETAAMIRRVYVTDVEMLQPKMPIFIKTRRPRGGGCDSIWIENLHAHDSKFTAIKLDMLGDVKHVGNAADRNNIQSVGPLTPSLSNIWLKDIRIDSCPTLLKVIGLPERPIEGLHLINVSAPNKAMQLSDVSSMTQE